jgi:hypothetical protein
MRMVERISDFPAVQQRLINWEGSAPQTGIERLALEEFHNQVVDAILTPDIEQTADVRMIESGDGSRFPLEALEADGIVGDTCLENLDGNDPIEPDIASPVDLTHPALADEGHDFVGTELLTRGQSHNAFNAAADYIDGSTGDHKTASRKYQ